MSQPDAEPGADTVDAPISGELDDSTDQDAESTNMAPPGERPTDQGANTD